MGEHLQALPLPFSFDDSFNGNHNTEQIQNDIPMTKESKVYLGFNGEKISSDLGRG